MKNTISCLKPNLVVWKPTLIACIKPRLKIRKIKLAVRKSRLALGKPKKTSLYENQSLEAVWLLDGMNPIKTAI